MKKFLSLFLVLSVLLMAVCAVSADDDFKVGVILLHDEQTGYDAAHIDGVRGAMERLDLDDDQVIIKYNIGENEQCYDAAVDLAEQGCTLIMSDSYGHQAFLKLAAEEYPEITFVSATGDTAWKDGLDNFSNMFPHTYESRYVSGVVAGMKLKQLMDDGKVTDPHIGYVGAYPYDEVVSGYTGFFLGIRSIVPEAYMEVIYTNDWDNFEKEKMAAESLIARGCVIIGQHADSQGAPSAVESARKNGTDVYSIGYNIDMREAAPTGALTSAQNNWVELYTHMIGLAMKGEKLPVDYSIGYADNANQISELGDSCAPGTAEAVEAVEAAIKDGTLHVFDTSTFTVKGETVTHWFALDTEGDFVPDQGEAIADGYFHESEWKSAPSFGIRIDGITELTNE
ncbi:MAG: BMP family ABC transporter substrate-binding protein [Anaerolineaceae bacterium]|nr:BMP family ABC transporter substrate-binding protein [Anaerolineaceae bacterium]